MSVSFAAIKIAYYVVNNKDMPDNLSFQLAANTLDMQGHYTLMVACNEETILNKFVLDSKNLEALVGELHPAVLKPYRIVDTDFSKKRRYLKVQETKEFAKLHHDYKGFRLICAYAPRSPASTGKVEVEGGGLFYPSVLGLYWE